MSLREPEVTYRFDGFPIDVRQYDDRIALHKPGRHRAHSRGRDGVCTLPSCHEEAVLDRALISARSAMPVWRALCHTHARKAQKRVAPAMALIVEQMLQAPRIAPF